MAIVDVCWLAVKACLVETDGVVGTDSDELCSIRGVGTTGDTLCVGRTGTRPRRGGGRHCGR